MTGNHIDAFIHALLTDRMVPAENRYARVYHAHVPGGAPGAAAREDHGHRHGQGAAADRQ